jgi:hypothetical protein
MDSLMKGTTIMGFHKTLTDPDPGLRRGDG